MQTPDQVAREAREKLAGEMQPARNAKHAVAEKLERLCKDWRYSDETIGKFARDYIATITSALRIEPEHGPEGMTVKAFRERALDALINLRYAAACNFSPEYSGAAGEARCDSFLEAYKVVRALPLHPAKDDGGGHG